MRWECPAWTTVHLERTAQSAYNTQIQLYFKDTSSFGSSTSHFWFERDGRTLLWKAPQASQCPRANSRCSKDTFPPIVIQHRLGVHGPTTALSPQVSGKSSKAYLSISLGISNQLITCEKPPRTHVLAAEFCAQHYIPCYCINSKGTSIKNSRS